MTQRNSRLLAAGFFLMVSAASAMELGSNFWNLKWHKPDDCFRDVKNVTGEDPWNPQFLKEIAIYRFFRFMDWDVTNNSERETWAQRSHKTETNQTTAAYEWMIDLCNRMNADLWICVPHRTVSRETADQPCDYALRLCLLVKTGVDMRDVNLAPLFDRLGSMTAEQLIAAGGIKTCEPLKPGLKMYIEYSNETWNGQFKQSHYCVEEGTALQLDPKGSTGKDGRQWTSGFRFHAWAAIRIFRAVDLVWGVDSKRVVRVLAQQAVSVFQTQQHQAVLNDSRFNPWGLKADAVAVAPYFGSKVSGDDPAAVDKLREAIRQSGEYAAAVKKITDAAGLELIAYEGGQHVIQKAAVINRDQAMCDLYGEYLREMSKYFSRFCHYAHVGRAGEKGSWGCIEFTGQAIDQAPKYRALSAWSRQPAQP
jgi:hypothetical protein